MVSNEQQLLEAQTPQLSCLLGVFLPRWISEREETRLQSVMTCLKQPPSRRLKDNQPEGLRPSNLSEGLGPPGRRVCRETG